MVDASDQSNQVNILEKIYDTVKDDSFLKHLLTKQKDKTGFTVLKKSFFKNKPMYAFLVQKLQKDVKLLIFKETENEKNQKSKTKTILLNIIKNNELSDEEKILALNEILKYFKENTRSKANKDMYEKFKRYIKVSDEFGKTILHYMSAQQQNQTEYLKLIKELLSIFKSEEDQAFLLMKQDNDGNCASHVATLHNNHILVPYLKKVCNQNIRNNEGEVVKTEIEPLNLTNESNLNFNDQNKVQENVLNNVFENEPVKNSNVDDLSPTSDSDILRQQENLNVSVQSTGGHHKTGDCKNFSQSKLFQNQQQNKDDDNIFVNMFDNKHNDVNDFSPTSQYNIDQFNNVDQNYKKGIYKEQKCKGTILNLNNKEQTNYEERNFSVSSDSDTEKNGMHFRVYNTQKFKGGDDMLRKI